MPSAKDIGKDLVDLCKKGQNKTAIEKYYDQNIVSVEAAGMGGKPAETKGLAAVMGKSEWWATNHEVHSVDVEGPFPHLDNKFAVVFRYDVTFKPEKRRFKMHEVAVFTVAGGKIAREEFYYPT